MSNFTNSPNMGLPVPTVGTDPAPDWANNLNGALTLIDQHNHSSGSGVQITPAGLNISSDLPFNQNNATLLRSVRFLPQLSVLSGAADLGCLFEVGVDLYYNDGNGNNIRITQSGGVAGSPGSIANLTSPASASYVSGSQTFVWQSAAATPANMDFGSAIFRNITANSNGITVSAPSALASNFTLTLPLLPASQKFLSLDNSGNIAASWAVDNSTLDISGNLVEVKNAGVTGAKLAPPTFVISSSSGLFGTTSGTATPVTNCSVTITAGGTRPIRVFLQGDGSSDSGVTLSLTGITSAEANLTIVDVSSSLLCTFPIGFIGVSGGELIASQSMVDFTDFSVIGSPGSKTYTLKAFTSSGNAQVSVIDCVLIAQEM